MFLTPAALVLLVAPGAAAPAFEDAAEPVVYPELGLTIQLPELEQLHDFGRVSDQMVGKWSGSLSGHQLEIAVFSVPMQQYGIVEPDGVLELVEADLSQGGAGAFRFTMTDLIEGSYGHAPYAAVGSGDLRTEEGERRATLFCMGGVTEDFAYSIEIECTPAASKAVAKQIVHFFEKGVSYEGEPWDHEWSEEEAEARWRRDAPPELADKMRAPLRTKHYIFLSNASGQDAFARQMEKNYKAIKKLFPFPEVKRRRLMPVFLFRTRDQYVEFYAGIAGISKSEAARSAGHAWRDYYATMYESPQDPTHLHEQVHQIFANRLRLGGGGSWFQEGVAEYAETRANERSGAARTVKKERHRRLPEFVQLQSLIYSTSGDNVKGGSEAGDLYKQAALLIEFLRESKFGKKGFPDFLAEVGRVPRGDVEAINAALMRVYEVDLVQLDALFVEYCKQR